MKIYLIGLVILLLPLTVSAENAGFVQGLWYDKTNPVVGEPLRIYAAIRNNTGSDLTGTVEFYVNGNRIKRLSVEALNGRIIEGWADWNPVYGTSSISATLSHTRITPVGETAETIEVDVTEAVDLLFVDRDTDEDGIGDRLDTDDDGDGIPDSEDGEPLVFNENEDGPEEEEVPDEEPVVTTQSSSDEPQGLEQFLTDNRAESALSNITTVINNSKKRLDSYREERAIQETESAEEVSTDNNSGTSTGSFGEITRSEAESSGGNWFSGVVSVAKAIASTAYTALLFILSAGLGHPAIVQILLLLFLLYFIYRLAKRLSRRDY